MWKYRVKVAFDSTSKEKYAIAQRGLFGLVWSDLGSKKWFITFGNQQDALNDAVHRANGSIRDYLHREPPFKTQYVPFVPSTEVK